MTPPQLARETPILGLFEVLLESGEVGGGDEGMLLVVMKNGFGNVVCFEKPLGKVRGLVGWFLNDVHLI